MNPKVSIALTTFNHERYLAQSLESILSQNVNFPYEIVIGEDASSDKTRKIAESYRLRFPDIIRALYRDKNLGYTINFDDILKNCRGEYIAIFDGDDIMLPGKLQAQANFLDNNPEFVLVGHNVRVFENETGNTITIASPPFKRKFYLLEDVIEHGSFIGNCSKMFRARSLPSAGIDHRIRYIADWYLTIQIARFGKLGYLFETYSDYRWHTDSIMRNLKGREHFTDKMLIINLINKQWDNKYDRLFSGQKAYAYLAYGINELIENNLDGAREKIVKSLYFKFNYSYSQYFYMVVAFSPKPFREFFLRFRNQYNHPVSETFQKKREKKGNTHAIGKNRDNGKQVHVFLFHRINPVRNALWNPIDPAYFEQIIVFLKKKFTIVPHEEFLLEKGYNKNYRKPACAITFDDGYKDFINYAVPILIRHNCPSSMFVITNSVDQDLPPWTYIRNHLFQNTKRLFLDIDTVGFPQFLKKTKWKNMSERLEYAKKLNPFIKTLSDRKRKEIDSIIEAQFDDVEYPKGLMMNWNDLREITKYNCIIGSHTISHPMLSRNLSYEEVYRELKGSAEVIKKNTGTFPKSISYPFGFNNGNVVKCAKEAGYEIGLTVEPVAFKSEYHNIFQIPRIELYNESFFKTRLRVNQIMPKIKRLFFQ